MRETVTEAESSGQRARAALRGAWRIALDWLTPPKCLVCRAAVNQDASLCLSCWQKLQFIDEPVCDALGTPFPHEEGEGALSPAAIAEPPAWDRGRAAVAFNETSRQIVHLLKYRDTQEAGIAMARMMAGAGRRLLADADIIVPVPLHRFRLWQRRFNQAAFLAQQLARQTGKRYHHDLLLRQSATRSQVGLTAEERQRNVKRAFHVPPEKAHLVAGRRILLIDDVQTTGATLAACTRTLKTAGAAKVDVLTFALVLEPKRLHIDA